MRLYQGYMISLCLWSNVFAPPACTVSSLAGNAAEMAPPGDTRTAAGTLSERWASASLTGIYKMNNALRCCHCWNDSRNKPEEDFFTLESTTAVRWMSGATPHVLMLARSCSSSHYSSGGRLWSPARQRDNPPTPSLMSAQGSWSPTRFGRGEQSSMAPERKMEICHEGEKKTILLHSGWCVFALQEVLLSPDQWRSSTLWCFPWAPEVGFKIQEVTSNTKCNTNISSHNWITTKASLSSSSNCFLYLFNTTFSRALPTSFPGTARAISSTQVTCRAWAAGFGNSLNLQSQLGNGPGDFPAMGERVS